MKTVSFLLPRLIIAATTAAIAMPVMAQLGMGRMGGGGDWFAESDSNGDGVVTRAEFMAHRDGSFGKLDRNGDGVVSPADFPRLAKAKPDAYARLTQMLGKADSNGDGAISRAELAATPPLMFDHADANHDGKVTKAEYDIAREDMRDALKARRN